MYTDGACSGNPGPAGIGVYMYYKQYKKEISKYIGNATNNIAEITAIKVGLENIDFKYRNTKIKIYTDSNYCIGVFTKNWDAKKNKELIKDTKKLISKFSNIEFIKVKGHEDDVGNIRADQLAVQGRRG